MSVNVDVETHLGVRAPRASLSVRKCVCECVCTCAMMGVGRGQAAPCQGQGMAGESGEGTWGWVMGCWCKSVPRANSRGPGGR